MTFLEDVIGRAPNSSDREHTKMMRPPPRIRPGNGLNEKTFNVNILYLHILDIGLEVR